MWKERPWLGLLYDSDICLEGMRKIMHNLRMAGPRVEPHITRIKVGWHNE